MNKKMPNKTHLRERLIASTLYMPEEEIVEKRDGASMLLIFSIVLNVFFVSILIMNTICLNNIEVYAYHGVFEVEQKVGQWYTVNLEIDVDFSEAAINDEAMFTLALSFDQPTTSVD